MRDVDLTLYLPEFLKEFKELYAALEAENPEFSLLWEASEDVLANEFITTADEYGISKFEDMAGILPSSNDTLEDRRTRLLGRWFNDDSYTLLYLEERLAILCGEDGYTLATDFDRYLIVIGTYLDGYGQVSELEKILEDVIPANIVIESANTVECAAQADAALAGSISFAEIITAYTGDE